MSGDRRAKKVAAVPDQESLEDRISALPDGVLQHLLGFLPAHEAVRTSVLARHWRHQWRSLGRLRINMKMPKSAEEFVKFVNRLLLLRAPGMELDEFQVSGEECLALDPEIDEEIHIWIRHALMCKARVLIINVPITLETPFSQHLRRLVLDYVCFSADCLDFATCPILEVLHMTEGHLCCSRILSKSVKHLQIRLTRFPRDIRACISMPSLLSLQLNNFGGKAPLLEFMPSLQTAFVKPGYLVDACMKRSDYGGDCCGICAYCCGKDDHRGRCILLGALSNATYLELIAHPGTFIFKRDMRWCPTFSKLKILLLNEWCVAIDLSALICILEHSPVLEKLTLQIFQDPWKTKSRRKYQMEREPRVSEHLKIVEIKCAYVGFQVSEILSFLSTFVMQVNVIRGSRNSTYTLQSFNSTLFSFEG